MHHVHVRKNKNKRKLPQKIELRKFTRLLSALRWCDAFKKPENFSYFTFCSNWLLFSFLFSLTSTWRTWKPGEFFLSRFCLKSLIVWGDFYLGHQRDAILESLEDSILIDMKSFELYCRSRKCFIYFQKLLYFHCLKNFSYFSKFDQNHRGESFTRTTEVIFGLLNMLLLNLSQSNFLTACVPSMMAIVLISSSIFLTRLYITCFFL